MKGIETIPAHPAPGATIVGSDHCPAMKGIETDKRISNPPSPIIEATTAPQ